MRVCLECLEHWVPIQTIVILDCSCRFRMILSLNQIPPPFWKMTKLSWMRGQLRHKSARSKSIIAKQATIASSTSWNINKRRSSSWESVRVARIDSTVFRVDLSPHRYSYNFFVCIFDRQVFVVFGLICPPPRPPTSSDWLTAPQRKQKNNK